MLHSLHFPFSFDVDRLAADLDNVRPEDWIPHFNQRFYEGEWSVASLRAVGGKAHAIYPDPTSTEYADTEILDRCAYYREVLNFFQCPLTAVRLMKLKPGSEIREHRDHCLGYEDGEVRIHIPVTTNPQVEFFLEGQQIPMLPGEMWYLNFSLRHRVANRGETERIHLVIDCVMNSWLDNHFQETMKKQMESTAAE
jgi:quercetin dioxygenase-like cupin family protein